ncbi:hypothetical protein L5515_002049 [Caenorhabditis briggsae]|uniref:Uncharacterized protein n=1 Tax=Caenorhabditis briggsae TaxID=6238 RepID=A0AAE9J4D1_CAEBR|nr:hypothetical protein L5515_002049 [Caenorhabditis briggsae]
MDCEEIDSEKKSGSGSDYDDDDAMNGDEDNEVDEARQTFAFVNVETRFRNRTAENVLAELLAQCKISGPAIIVSVDRLPIKGGANNKHMITFKLDDVEDVTIS